MDLEVFDKVCNVINCKNIINLNQKFIDSGHVRVHYFFDRRSGIYNNPFDYFLEDFCKKMGDDSPIIEYWIRSNWVKIKCHQDVDEYILETTNEIRIPNFGHILYLRNDPNEAATLLFDKEFEKMYVVNPKAGRIARFRGDIFHYVPFPFTSIYNFDDVGEEDIKRPVLLFNTWNEYHHYPDAKIQRTNSIVKINFSPVERWIKNEEEYYPLDTNIQIKIQNAGKERRRLCKEKEEFFEISEKIKDYNPCDFIDQNKIAVYQINKAF